MFRKGFSPEEKPQAVKFRDGLGTAQSSIHSRRLLYGCSGSVDWKFIHLDERLPCRKPLCHFRQTRSKREPPGLCRGNWLLLPGWYTRKMYSDTSHRHRLAYRSSRSGQIPPRFEPMSSRSYPLRDTSNGIPPVRAGASRRQEGLRFVFSSSDTPLFHVSWLHGQERPQQIKLLWPFSL